MNSRKAGSRWRNNKAGRKGAGHEGRLNKNADK